MFDGTRVFEPPAPGVGGCGTFFRVDPETVGEFTGLVEDRDTGEPGYKHSQGDEFYEHDIVDYSTGHGCRIGEIVWENDVAGFAVEWIPRPLRTQPSDKFTCDIACMSTKLGNRHDNPELLDPGTIIDYSGNGNHGRLGRAGCVFVGIDKAKGESTTAHSKPDHSDMD